MKVFIVNNNQVKEFVPLENVETTQLNHYSLMEQIKMNQEKLSKSLEPESELITISKLTKLFSTTRPTIYSWIEKGLLNPIKIGGRVYFKQEDINTLLKASQNQQKTK